MSFAEMFRSKDIPKVSLDAVRWKDGSVIDYLVVMNMPNGDCVLVQSFPAKFPHAKHDATQYADAFQSGLINGSWQVISWITRNERNQANV